VIERLLTEEVAAIAAAAADIERRRPRYAVIAARGSSDNAARYAQHLIGRFWGIPSGLATPSLHTLYEASLRYDDALVIGISRSGDQPDVSGVLVEATAQGALTVAITNEPDSPLAGAARHVIRLQTGPERSSAALKTYTASLAAVAALAGGAESLERVPDAVHRQLSHPVPEHGWDRVAVLGRGANYATAFEAALKLTELTGAIAAPWSAADFVNGPFALIGPGFPLLAFAPSGPTLPGMRDLLGAAAERGASLTVVSDAPITPDRIRLEPTEEWLSPLVAVVPAQLLAVEAAERAS
jgi:glucosamine--fructose-6-phosphate aminotransferase (isomerizing)